MNNTKTTKRALLSGIMAMLLCVTMLIGSTFAWFTDSASTAVNKIQAGTLDVALLDAAGNSVEGQSLTWKTADGRAQDKILWEPGCTYELQPVVIKNNGNLALKYKIVISGINGSAKLNEAIEWTINDADLGDDHSLAVGASDTLTIKGHMKEEVGNEYQGLSIDSIGITVVATQDTVENDSFGDQYDEDAENVIVSNNTEAQNSIMTGSNSGTAAGTKVVDVLLSDDVTLDLDANGGFYNATLGGTASENVTIDANGNKITFDSDYRNAINCYGKLTISNAELDSTYKTGGSTWDDYALIFRYKEGGANEVVFNNVTFDRQVSIEKGVKATFNNCTINQTAATGDMYALWIQAGADVTLNGCIINSVNPNAGNNNRAIKIADEYVDAPTVTNLSVSGTTITSQKKAAVLVTSTAGANIVWGAGNNISGVAADTVNAVWNDSDRAAAWDLVTVTGCTMVQE